MLCECNCGNHLTGKQKRFYSDACRKRHNRRGLHSVRVSSEIKDTVSCIPILTTFPDGCLSENSKLHVVEVLSEAAKYEETWVKRILASPECSTPSQLEMFQESAAWLRNLVDELVN